MKILHVIRDLDASTGGPVHALKGLSEAQAKLGHDVLIVTTDRGDFKVIPNNVDVHMSPCWSRTWSWAPLMNRALATLVPSVDILHLHMVWDYPVWAAARSAKRYGKPFILRPCGNLDEWSLSQKKFKKRSYLRLFGSIVKDSTAIHFTSHDERLGSQVPITNKKAFVIPVGVTESAYTDLPDKTAFAKRFPECVDRRLVLFLGRLHAKKQPDVLVHAFSEVCALADDLHLVLAGPADEYYLNSLCSLVEKLDLDDRVTFTGLLRGEAIKEAYRAAEVFVLPSLQENFGIAIVEAMAASCPVIVSDKVNIAVEIEQAGAGLACSPDVGSTAQAIQRLLNDSTLRQGMGENGRKIVLENFTWDLIAKSLNGIYAELLA